MVENLFRGHPSGEHPLHLNPFFIREIREIRGFNCCNPLVPTAVFKFDSHEIAGFDQFCLAPLSALPKI